MSVRNRDIKLLMDHHAQRYGGKLKRRFFGLPSLRIFRGSTFAKFYYKKNNDDVSTYLVHIPKQKKEYSLTISPQRYKKFVITPGPDVQDIIVGDPAFDREYIVQSDHEEHTKKFINRRMRNKLVELKDAEIRIVVTPNKIELYSPEFLDTAVECGDFLDLGFELMEQTKLFL